MGKKKKENSFVISYWFLMQHFLTANLWWNFTPSYKIANILKNSFKFLILFHHFRSCLQTPTGRWPTTWKSLLVQNSILAFWSVHHFPHFFRSQVLVTSLISLTKIKRLFATVFGVKAFFKLCWKCSNCLLIRTKFSYQINTRKNALP